MRKSQRYPNPDKGRDSRRQTTEYSYDDLEPPVRQYEAPAQPRAYDQERYRGAQGKSGGRAPEYGARRPAQPRAPQKFDLEAFEQEKRNRSAYTGYDLNAFSVERGRPPQKGGAQPSGRPHSGRTQNNVPPPRGGGYGKEPYPSRPAPPPRNAQQRPANGQPRPRPERGQQAPYRNREEQRRQQNQRRAKRLKRRRAIMGAFLGVTLIVVAVVLCFTVFFKVNEIKIEGTQLYTSEQVLAMLNFKQGDNMLLIPRSEQAEALPNKMPYVKRANIKLSLPSTVVVTIEDAVAQYYYPSEDGTFTYLDDTLKVLSTGEAELPQVENPVSMEGTAFKTLTVGQKAVFEDEKIQAAMEEMLKAVAEVKMEKVTGLMAINQTTNFIIYDGRITIKLGEATNVSEKLSRAYASIQKMGQTDVKGTMDVTVGKYAYFTESNE